jgi:nucleoredoxin
MHRLLHLLTIALAATATAAPMTVKEIDFLVRQRTPESEISSQLQQRRLLAPLDPAGETQLLEHGATPGLIALLKQGHLVLSPAEAQSFALRAAPSSPAPTAPPPQPPGAPSSVPNQTQRSPFIDQLAGKLVQLDGDELKPLDAGRLKDVRVFAIYSSAMWCGPCRKFTPKLVEYYKQVKAKHPEFEVIFLSGDRDEFNMGSYMRTQRMPWPALRFGAQGELQKLYCGDSIPWLVCIASDGRPLTKNGEDKKYIAPDEVLGAIDFLLAQVK